MYIEEIVLDGFKSYQKRTVIGRFNPKFNAITGFNGSGKSNILDSICFVLGITNLSQIRINKLEELIYKSGQAGINKASVSIIFNNEDKSNSSPLYRDLDKITVTRQIATGGRNRYLINGTVVKPMDVTNFFHSVQLNVNSSHFLIMQGRITKVINMKPKELLSMIEEAAGTRMYETKKQQSLKLIEKKNSKLNEINRMLEEDIIPKFERIKKEKTDYLKWASINEEVELYERLCTLHQFKQILNETNSLELNLENMKTELNNFVNEVDYLNNKISSIQKIIDEEENKMSSKWSTPLRDCKERISYIESNVNMTQVQLNELNTDLKDEENIFVDMTKQQKEIQEKLCSEKTEKNENNQSNEFIMVEKRLKDLKELLENSKKILQRIRTGCDSGSKDSEQKSLRQSLFDTQKELNNISVEEKKIKLKIEDMERTLKPLKNKISKCNSNNKQKNLNRDEYNQLKAHVEKLQADINRMKGDAELFEKYSFERKRLKIDNDSLEIQLQPIEMFIRNIQCIYDSGTNRELAVQTHINSVDMFFSESLSKTKVKGSVFELFYYNDSKYSTALEMVAGGRLYNMVVENSEIGKKLLNSGLIKKRVTLIPLDKIIDPSISEATLKHARKLTNCNGDNDLRVVSPMNLIKFNEELLPAMKYCFGHTIICENESFAKNITFNPDIAVRTVTLKGDIYDPSGTLSGGSAASNNRSILETYKEYNDLRLKILNNNKRIEEIEKNLLPNLNKSAEGYRHSLRQLEIDNHQLKLIEERLEKENEYSTEAVIDNIKKEIEALKIDLTNCESKSDELIRNKVRLEKEIKEFEYNKGSREQEIEDNIEGYKKEIKELTVIHQNLEKVTFSSRIEKEVLSKELEHLNENIDKKRIIIDEIKKSLFYQNSKLNELQGELKDANDSLLKLQKEIESSNDIIKDNRTELKRIGKAISKKQIEITKISHEISTLNQNLTKKNKVKDSMVRQFEWLHDNNFTEKFDLESHKYKDCINKLEELQREKDNISKNINRRALNIYEKVNTECNELINKRDIVTKDKDKIEDVINDLDQKKKQALENTWKAVNVSFGSIFSTLLPNANAELVQSIDPEDESNDLYGLEFKVELGGVWKKSLTELSGGQRSLLALSLVLAMLRFKPAPVYILDEIDSALDLGHTQNIGKMIKNHFPNSQFIIVSLKEGMFNNANVLFRTELIHGVSTVNRFENNKLEDFDDENQNINKVVKDIYIKEKTNVKIRRRA
ncbi:SMC2 protein [Cryptosporidium ryanae]|uniref:SMC2 protein n=1 Tax=Cryptosporidium ryanae TaxID=515981 RepID=UPI003519FAA1|nr:SMC2 protein [Cryptosporidium ryanae]